MQNLFKYNQSWTPTLADYHKSEFEGEAWSHCDARWDGTDWDKTMTEPHRGKYCNETQKKNPSVRESKFIFHRVWWWSRRCEKLKRIFMRTSSLEKKNEKQRKEKICELRGSRRNVFSPKKNLAQTWRKWEMKNIEKKEVCTLPMLASPHTGVHQRTASPKTKRRHKRFDCEMKIQI